MSEGLSKGRICPNDKQEFSSCTSRNPVSFWLLLGYTNIPVKYSKTDLGPGKQRVAAAATLWLRDLLSEVTVTHCSKNHRFIYSVCQLLADLQRNTQHIVLHFDSCSVTDIPYSPVAIFLFSSAAAKLSQEEWNQGQWGTGVCWESSAGLYPHCL